MKLLSKILLGIFMVLFGFGLGFAILICHPNAKEIEPSWHYIAGTIFICIGFLASVIFYGYAHDELN